MLLTDCEKLVDELFVKHNLNEWNFRFDRAVKRFGQCKFNDKQITLSKKLVELNNIEVVKNTLLHEIAHALVGPGNGHNYKWWSKALEIGCDGKTRYDTNKVIIAKLKYTGICRNCKKEITHQRKHNLACKNCCDKYNNGNYSLKFQFDWKLS